MNRFSDLCAGRYYIIPQNQRGYSWAPEHAEEILSDLNLAGTHAHYMGPIIVTRTGEPDFQDDDLNTTVEFTLEDGQQRLTTFFMIASEILKRIEVINGAPDIESTEIQRLLFYNLGGPQLRLKNSNADLHQYFSFLLTGSPSPPGQRTPPMFALDRVQACISRFFLDKDLPSLIIWKKKLVNQAKFIWVDLASESVNRYLTFDAINSRGLALSEFDKIKNFCILITTHCGIPVQPEEEWYKAITKLEHFKVSTRFDEASFISELYAAFFDEKIGQGNVHASFVERFRKLLTTRDPHLEDQLQAFVQLWEPMAHSFGFVATKNRNIYYGSLCSLDAGQWLDRLDNMELPTITRIILTACHKSLSPTQFAAVARACEIYTFRVYAAIGYRKDKFANHISHLAHEVLIGGAQDSAVLERICLWLKDLAPMSMFLSRLGDGEAKYYHDPRIRGWVYCYYFLYEYELSCSPLGVSPIAWESSGQGRINTQEHILPQTHRDGDWWEANWPDHAEADRFKHRLGNLTLTSNNSALGRKSIDLKINDPKASHYYDHPNATNSEKRIRLFTDGVSWNPVNILSREYEMLQFASKRWSIPCCSDNGEYPLSNDFWIIAEKHPSISVNLMECVNCAGVNCDNVLESDEGEEDEIGEFSQPNPALDVIEQI
jgi:hypothetical protein